MGLGDALRDEDRLQPNGQAYDNLRESVWRSDARIAELETALRGLYHECVEAGHGTDKDYKWPVVMAAAKKALNEI